VESMLADEVKNEEREGSGYTHQIFREVHRIIEDTKGQAGALIRVLQQAQGLLGYLPGPIIKTISRDMKVPLSEVYGIISFYHFFSTIPKGKHVIQVCTGTACYVKGAEKILEAMRTNWGLEPKTTTPDGRYSLETVRCLGCCGLSPVMAIGKKVYRQVKPSQLKGILNAYR
jgi:NADH:ubiquinone oxidoreductase subunit E